MTDGRTCWKDVQPPNQEVVNMMSRDCPASRSKRGAISIYCWFRSKWFLEKNCDFCCSEMFVVHWFKLIQTDSNWFKLIQTDSLLFCFVVSTFMVCLFGANFKNAINVATLANHIHVWWRKRKTLFSLSLTHTQSVSVRFFFISLWLWSRSIIHAFSFITFILEPSVFFSGA